MNFHTAKMVAQKHNKRAIRDPEDGTPIVEISGDMIRELTTVALEVRLGVRQQEAP